MLKRTLSFGLLAVTGAILSQAGCANHRCCAPPSASLRVPLAPGAGCWDSRSAASPLVTAVAPPVAAASPPSVRFAAPLPPAPPQATPPASGFWQSPPGIQPHVTETRPIPVPSPNGTGAAPRLRPPQDANDPRLLPPMPPAENAPPVVTPDPSRQADAGAFPVDIPQYHLVADGVAAGLLPFPGGWDWLKEHGYRAVLHVRAADEDAAAIRTEVESKGLKYLTMQVEARTLNRDLVQEFSRTIRGTAEHPLFVFDRKGMLAGTLWYLHFRLTDQMAEPLARARAVRLGLREETTGEYADLWLAINQVLRGI